MKGVNQKNYGSFSDILFMLADRACIYRGRQFRIKRLQKILSIEVTVMAVRKKI
jgi:hypothetical protein